MRKTGPVSQREFVIDDGATLVSTTDLKSRITYCNAGFVAVSGYGREELIGQPHNTTRHPDMPKETFKELWQTIGRGQIFRGVIKNRAKDGTPYYVDAVVAPILGENGKPMNYLVVRYDITEAEIERQNARGILAAIDASYAYIEFDLGGHVLRANNNFLNTLGYRADEITGPAGTSAATPPSTRWRWRARDSGRPRSTACA